MYRIHFTAAGALRTERAVLEFGVDGIRWRFGEEAAAERSTRRHYRSPNSPVMHDFSERLVRLRRWRSRRARATALLHRPGSFLLKLLRVGTHRSDGAAIAPANNSLNPLTMPLVDIATGQENP